MVAINIATLKEGTHDVVLEPEAGDLDLDPERFEDIRVEARLDYFDGRIVVAMRAGATATLECDRTLQLFKQRLSGSYTMLFEPAGEEASDEEEEFQDVRPLDPWDREIDITDAVRDTLVLSIPARCIAPGAEDLEIQTQFGEAENEIDPRWEALAKLRAGQSREE
ncbi:MAG TPA: DUF177 domain-containing protein [Rhodothermales bacterium]